MSNQPPVTWQEIRDHLSKRLMLDAEWTVHGDGALIWQPWLAPVHVEVLEHGQYADGFPWVAVKAWMRVADLPEQVIASVGVTLNGDGRSNLVWFHNAVLAMATVAHELATDVLEGLRPPDVDAVEARLGRRQVPDELLGIFAEGEPLLPMDALEEVAPAWELARPLLEQRMAAMGFDPGYRDDGVDFYAMGGVAVGVRLQEDAGRYGTGLDVLAMVSPTMDPQPPYSGFANDANVLLGSLAYANVGNVHWSDSGQGWGGLEMASHLPGPFLGEFRRDPENLATAVFNVLMQVSLSARALTAVDVQA